MARINELRLIMRVAHMYFVEHKKQLEISKQLHISQASVSRLVKRAHQENIVRITIDSPKGTYPEIENEIRHLFNISEVIVADCLEDREGSILRSIGDAAAHYLETTMREGEVIGISSWSQTISEMVDNIRPMKRLAASKVVQMLGGMGNPGAQIHATQIITKLSQVTNAEPVLLSAQGLASSREAKLVMLGDPYVRIAVDDFRNITLAIVGIGAIGPSQMLAKSGNVFTQYELATLESLGAVGDISLRFFDRNGNPTLAPLDDRVIGASIEEIKAIPRVVGLAGGGRKVAAIAGTMRGGIIDTLITDRFTAAKLVKHAKQAS